MTSSKLRRIRVLVPRAVAIAGVLCVGVVGFDFIRSATGVASPTVIPTQVIDNAVPLPLEGVWRFTPAAGMPHLLPLTGDVTRLCGRWTDDDQMVAEFVNVHDSSRNLLRGWRSDGWQVRHTLWGDSHSFSFLGVKDGTVVYAWSPQRGRIKQLLLSRTPDVSVSNVLATDIESTHLETIDR